MTVESAAGGTLTDRVRAVILDAANDSTESAQIDGAVAEIVTAIERIKASIDASVCPSNTHDEPVPATVAGLFLNPSREDATSSPVAYCGPCAKTGEDLGFFTPAGGTE